MIRTIEATGKTVDEALSAGCAQLGVSSDDLDVSYEVLEMPVRKLFKTLPAKVKITLTLDDEPETTAPVAEAAPVQEAPAAAAAPVVAAPEMAEVAEVAVKAEQADAPAAEAADETEEPIDIENDAKVKAAVEYLQSIVVCMGVADAQFAAVRKGEATIIKVTGEDLGVLIGRRGETMESLSYLASLVANRVEGDYIKLGLDVAGYRGKREQDLTALAQRIGAKVVRTGRSFAMEPMNPYERRIIHSAISGMEGLRSESKGEGKDRRVVIYSTAPDAQNDHPDHERRGGPRGANGRSGGGYRGNGRGNGGSRGPRSGGNDRGGYRGGNRSGGSVNRGPRPSSVPERSFTARDAAEAAPVAPKRTEHVDDFAGMGFGKIDL